MNLSDEERQRRADRMREVAAKGRAAKAQAAKAEFEAIETGYIPPKFPWDGEKDEQKAKELFDVWVEETKTVMPAILPAMREVIAKQKASRATKTVPFDVARYLRLKAFYAKKKAAGQ